jgi:hypothetical protein
MRNNWPRVIVTCVASQLRLLRSQFSPNKRDCTALPFVIPTEAKAEGSAVSLSAAANLIVEKVYPSFTA